VCNLRLAVGLLALALGIGGASANAGALQDPTRPPERFGGPAATAVVDPAAPAPLELKSTLLRRGRRLAVINDQLLTIGDEIAGYRIKRIESGGVLLERGTVVVELGLGSRAVAPADVSSAAREQGR